jgi:hypothetical protein
LKSHRVQQVREEQHQPVAEIMWQSITKALAASIATLPPKLTWKETASHYAVHWKIVATAVRHAVEGMNNNRKLTGQSAHGIPKTDHYIIAIGHGCGGLPLQPAPPTPGQWKPPEPSTERTHPPLHGKPQKARFPAASTRPCRYQSTLVSHFSETRL